MSWILIIESLIFFLVPEYRFLIADKESGFRFSSLFLNSYLMTGVFLIFGCLYMLQTPKSQLVKLICLILFSARSSKLKIGPFFCVSDWHSHILAW